MNNSIEISTKFAWVAFIVNAIDGLAFSKCLGPKPTGFYLRTLREIRRRSGFSLVEVTLAMCIVSVGFITMMGLLSSGLSSFHEGITTTVSSQIAQEVINSVQQTDFNELAAQTYYFDDQGDQLSTANKAQAVYQVNLAVATSTALPGSTANSNLATVTVQVARYPGTLTINWASPPPGISLSTYSTQVAKDF